MEDSRRVCKARWFLAFSTCSWNVLSARPTSELQWWWTSTQQSKVCGKTVFTRLIWMKPQQGSTEGDNSKQWGPWKNNNMYDQAKTPYNPNHLQVSLLYNVSICDTGVKTVDSETCGFTYISCCEFSSGVETEWLREGTAKITLDASARPFFLYQHEWLMFASLLSQSLSERKELTKIIHKTSVIAEKAARPKDHKQNPSR